MQENTDIAVLVHGYHLEALGWESIVWGNPKEGMFGSIPRGVVEAYKNGAVKIFWGTGASEKGGIKESQYIYNFALSHIEELADLCGCDPAELRTFIEERSYIDLKAQNTVEELKECFDMCLREDIPRIIIIPIATHASRSVKVALSTIFADPAYTGFHHSVYLAPADTSFSGSSPDDVVVVEPPHRGDQPKWQTFRYMKAVFEIQKKGESTFVSFLSDFGALLEKYGVQVTWKSKL